MPLNNLEYKSSGQCPRLLLQRSEFKSCWLLNLYKKTKTKNKEGRRWPIFKKSLRAKFETTTKFQKIRLCFVFFAKPVNCFIGDFSWHHLGCIIIITFLLECVMAKPCRGVRTAAVPHPSENCTSVTPLRWSHSEKIVLYSENFFSLRLTMKRLSRKKNPENQRFFLQLPSEKL